MTKAEIARTIYEVAHITGEFTLRSGQVSNEYFDKYLFEAQPILLCEIAKQMIELIPQNTDVLAGLEMGGIPVATALSLETSKPLLLFAKRQRNMKLASLQRALISKIKMCACLKMLLLLVGK